MTRKLKQIFRVKLNLSLCLRPMPLSGIGGVEVELHTIRISTLGYVTGSRWYLFCMRCFALEEITQIHKVT